MEKCTSDFWISGINYKKTDATIRGSFSINNEQYKRILEKASALGLKECLILSTCNRSEIYAVAADQEILTELICSESTSSQQVFQELAYTKQGVNAIQHLFHVTAGLDSQVLGDYEIVGQVRQAAKFSKAHGLIGPYMERLVNSALQSSKAIRTTTRLSGGTVSVSFAAIQYIKDNVQDYKQKKILLIGTGKLGRNTCKNIVDYLHNRNVKLINRTADKAIRLADELGLKYCAMEELSRGIAEADIIITSTNSPSTIINLSDLQDGSEKLIIDLSIPYNVDPEAAKLPHTSLLNVDELSRIKDESLREREAEVPRALEIIAEHISEFQGWVGSRKHVPVLLAIKEKLHQIEYCPLMQNSPVDTSIINSQKIQRVINNTAVKLQSKDNRGCHYIAAINDLIG